MKLFPLILAPLALLAACGSGGVGNSSAASTGPAATKAPPAGKAWIEVVSKTAEGGWRMGNPQAPITLIEYGSRACPVCARFEAEGFGKLKEGPIARGQMSYEFRDYPVHGPLDLAPILLGQCVSDEAFFPLLEQMFADQPTLLQNAETVAQQLQAQNLPPAALATAYGEQLGYLEYVKQHAGLPEAQARACLSNDAAIKRIADRADEAAKKYRVSGTPTFVLNGETQDGVFEWAGLQERLRAAGATGI